MRREDGADRDGPSEVADGAVFEGEEIALWDEGAYPHQIQPSIAARVLLVGGGEPPDAAI